MMTRRQFELIADVLASQKKNSKGLIGTAAEQWAGGEEMRRDIAGDLARVLRRENPRFNADRFLVASGVFDE